MTSNSADSVRQPGRTRHRRGGTQAVSGGAAEGAGQNEGRRPEGPPHARKGSAIQTAKRTLSEFKEDNLTDVAAALTYYAVLSIFPALIALIALVGLVGNPQTITNELTKLVSSIGPASSAQKFKEPIASLAHGSSKTGILLIVGSPRRCGRPQGTWRLHARLQKYLEVEEGRSFIKLRPLRCWSP